MNEPTVWAQGQVWTFPWLFRSTLQCGQCSYTWKTRLPTVDYPTVKCPNCSVLNTVPVEIDDRSSSGE